MPATTSIKSDFNTINGYRKGARYCKMDLHTHSPASECSSFSLPTSIDAILPPKTKNSKYHEQSRQLLEKLASGENPFEAPYNRATLAKRPRLGKRPVLSKKVLKEIAQEWQDELETVNPDDLPKLTSAEKTQEDILNNFMIDIRHYLESLFFPEEFVMRCYIEGLEIVALTDHNHPGYIVPRLPKLGTWLSAMQAVNKAYVEDITRKSKPGEKVRALLLKRLKLAKTRLKRSFDEKSTISAETEKNHDEGKQHTKALKNLRSRKKHIEDRIEHWKNPENQLRPLTLLPGVEFTVSDVHILGIFPPEWYVPGRIGSILRNIGIPEEQWGRGFIAAATSSVQDTISLVNAEDGIAIPAHSNSSFKGLLRLFTKGLALTKVLEHEALLALESTGGTIIKGKGGKRGKDACATLEWLDSGSSRPRRRRSLTFIKGSDAHECRIELDGTGEDLGARHSYVKMDIRKNDTEEEIFRSLRLSLMNGPGRVLEEPLEDGYSYTGDKSSRRIKKSQRQQLIDCESYRPTIIGLSVSGKNSYADDLKISFNPYLNCMVGSGGKSTIVRLVAYAFGIRGFEKWTKKSWLPELVRVFWCEGGIKFCVERKGRSIDPNADEVRTRYLEQYDDGSWEIVCESPHKDIRKLANMVDIWPPPEVMNDEVKAAKLRRISEDELIDDLSTNLKYATGDGSKPLLVNQPRDIFNNAELFTRILSKPNLKARQIIWSTGSPNVPTALDAEKIFITREKPRKRQMELICAGDLHEDEIREQFVNHFEGGWIGFSRRNDLYSI